MSDFEEFYADLWKDAQEQGPEGLSEMRGLSTLYRLCADLTARRKARGLTQNQLAQLTGIGQPEISRIESGQINVTVSTLGALAGALDLELQLVAASKPAAA